MAKLKKGVYKEKEIAPAQKRQLKGELRSKMAKLLKRSDDAHHKAQMDLIKLRSIT